MPLNGQNIHNFDRFSATFRMLYPTHVTNTGNANEIRDAKEKCEAAARDLSRKDYAISEEPQVWDIKHLASGYQSNVFELRRSRSNITDLVDFFAGKLPDTVGGQVKRVRVQEWLIKSYDFKDK